MLKVKRINRSETITLFRKLEAIKTIESWDLSTRKKRIQMQILADDQKLSSGRNKKNTQKNWIWMCCSRRLELPVLEL